MSTGTSQRVVHHPLFARLYARVAAGIEDRGAAEHRQRLLSGLAGRVIEVGAGTGANFRHYPPAVAEVLAVEPESYLRDRAVAAAAEATVPVTVVDGVADRLPAVDGSFDAAVCSLVLCSVPSVDSAMAELRRVLRPGGRLHFWEHVRADDGALPRVQSLLDRTIWPVIGGGCHTARDPLGAMERAGFAVDRLERFRFPETQVRQPTSPHILGVAVRT